MPITLDDVRAYYDQNTQLFIGFGKPPKAQNIHRGIWTDGVKNLAEALDHTNDRIRAEIEAVAPVHARIADLGCEVGAGLFHILPRLTEPDYAVGVTLSSLQARLAGQSAKELNLSSQILFTESDFSFVPLESGSLDAVFAVESVAHAIEPESFFQEVSRLLRIGGRLILLDDYRAARTLAPEDEVWLNAFMNGWHVPGVTTVEQTKSFASNHQMDLIKSENLTSLLRLQNLPNSIAKFLLFLGNCLPIQHSILPSMLGSMALQQCLYMGIIEYQFLVFQKIES